MPFDPIIIHRPTVTVLPPTPPDPPKRGGGPPRIHIAIEIVQRQPPQRATADGHMLGTLTLRPLALAVLVALAGCTRAMAQEVTIHRAADGQRDL